MALRAASSLMSYTGPDGCSHSRPTVTTDDGLEALAPDWILECGPCEASLMHHELWGPALEPAPLTADELRLRDAQHADATRNLWSGLASMPDQFAALAAQNHEQFAALVAQNSGVMTVLAKLMGVDLSNGLPALPAGALPGAPAGMVQGQAPAVPPPPAPPATTEKAAKKTTPAKKATPPRAQKPTSRPDAG